jgi:hypothetical protein
MPSTLGFFPKSDRIVDETRPALEALLLGTVYSRPRVHPWTPTSFSIVLSKAIRRQLLPCLPVIRSVCVAWFTFASVPDWIYRKFASQVYVSRWLDNRRRNTNPVNPAENPLIVGFWFADGSMKTLDEVLDEQGLAGALQGWGVFNSAGMSDDGGVVGFIGINAEGVNEPFILVLDPFTSVPGDFNADGTVDAADYVVWPNGLGM